MRTEELIVHLAGASSPVQPLPRLLVRLAQWIAAALPVPLLGIIVIGPRVDLSTAITRPHFVWLAIATVLTSVLAAIAALVLSVPGAERSPLQRALPLIAGSAWILILVALLAGGGEPVRRVMALPIHWACIIEIGVLGFVPGWALFAMLRRAAPLRQAWSAALAALAGAALGAVAVQLICPIDDPAHQLVAHVLPVAVFAIWGAITGRRRLNWLRGLPALMMIVVLCAGATAGAQAPGKLPPVIPIFPLEEAMIFPGVSRPLHIFEPRYRAMIADALKGDRIIGMTTLRPGFEANYAGRPPIYEIGCAGVITDVEELPGGRFNIVLSGIVKFRVGSEDDSKPYRLAHVDAIPEVLNDTDRATLRKQRQKLEALITKGSDSKIPPETSDEALVNWVAQYLPMAYAQRQALLELNSVLLRAQALIDLIESKAALTV